MLIVFLGAAVVVPFGGELGGFALAFFLAFEPPNKRLGTKLIELDVDKADFFFGGAALFC